MKNNKEVLIEGKIPTKMIHDLNENSKRNKTNRKDKRIKNYEDHISSKNCK